MYGQQPPGPPHARPHAAPWRAAAALNWATACAVLAVALFIGVAIGGESSGLGRVLAIAGAFVVALFAVIPVRLALAFGRRSPSAPQRSRVATRVGCMYPVTMGLIFGAVGFVRSVLTGDAILQLTVVLAVLLGLGGLVRAGAVAADRVAERIR